MSQCVKLIMLVKRDQQINKDRREERIRLLYRAEVRRQLQRRRLSAEIYGHRADIKLKKSISKRTT